MGITLILLAPCNCPQRRLWQEGCTAIRLFNPLRSHHKPLDLRTEGGRAVGADTDMLHPQYMDKDQDMTTALARYNISSRKWVLGLGREYSNMHTL